jgi:hypothetical protein
LKIGTLLSISAFSLLMTSFIKSPENENHIPGITSLVNTSFGVVDAQTDVLVPANRIYHRSEALELKKKLEEMHLANPNDIVVNMALVRYHACAPNFAGGFKGVAFQHAAAIYRQNAYVGCMAYEYIYSVNDDLKHAEEWYKLSLACQITEGMEWREVTYNKIVNFGIGVKGGFSNGKIQALYQNGYGTHKRKIMMPKCGMEKCEFILVPGFLRGSSSIAVGKLLFTPY